MAQYSHVISIILVAAAVCPPALTAPVTSATVSETAVDDQNETSQIAVDNPLCFETGMRVLEEEGNNAVDAAIASLLCLGVVNFQSSGIGGGMVMVVAEKDPNGGKPKVTVIDSRIVAPDSVEMGDTYTRQLARIGPSSIAVPGELRGIEVALNKFSNNTEEKRNALFADAIKYAEKGFSASKHLAYAIQKAIVKEPSDSESHSFHRSQSASWFQELKKLLLQKVDVEGKYVQKGDTIRARPKLTATLRAIAKNGFAEFYTGTTATNLRSDISRACAGRPYFCRKLEHIITSEDLAEYEVKTRAPFKFSYDASSGYDVYTAPAPYGGPALAVFLGIVTRKVVKTSLEHNVYHYLTEAAKFAASYRMNIGDPDKNSKAHVTPAQAEAEVQGIIKKLVDDQARPATNLDYYHFRSGKREDGMGTTHLSVVTPNMAVAVTSSINDFFGSGFLSPSTGILLNNDMDGFSLNNVRFPFNTIMPRKRPLSAKCPTIVVDSEGNFTLVTGAAGGTRIPPAVGQTMLYALTRKTSAKVASCQPRVYADLLKDGDTNIAQQVEKVGSSNVSGLGITSKILMWLRDDHNQPPYEDYTPISVVQSILNVGGTLDAHSDVRKFGGDCDNTVLTTSWGIQPNVKLLLLLFSFVLQYVCIHL